MKNTFTSKLDIPEDGTSTGVKLKNGEITNIRVNPDKNRLFSDTHWVSDQRGWFPKGTYYAAPGSEYDIVEIFEETIPEIGTYVIYKGGGLRYTTSAENGARAVISEPINELASGKSEDFYHVDWVDRDKYGNHLQQNGYYLKSYFVVDEDQTPSISCAVSSTSEMPVETSSIVSTPVETDTFGSVQIMFRNSDTGVDYDDVLQTEYANGFYSVYCTEQTIRHPMDIIWGVVETNIPS